MSVSDITQRTTSDLEQRKTSNLKYHTKRKAEVEHCYQIGNYVTMQITFEEMMQRPTTPEGNRIHSKHARVTAVNLEIQYDARGFSHLEGHIVFTTTGGHEMRYEHDSIPPSPLMELGKECTYLY